MWETGSRSLCFSETFRMKRVFCVGYREWALRIYKKVQDETNNILIISKEFDEKIHIDLLEDFKPDYILFYGWSDFVPSAVTSRYKCLMLHPSRLPKYRGGSPLQNQIIRGVEKSAVTIFEMNDIMDGGRIYKQVDLSLEGDISDIFKRIERIGVAATKDILVGDYCAETQDESEASAFKRRRPSESEITIEEIRSCSAKYLHDKIRMLTDPYPNAFIRTSDGKKLLITASRIESS